MFAHDPRRRTQQSILMVFCGSMDWVENYICTGIMESQMPLSTGSAAESDILSCGESSFLSQKRGATSTRTIQSRLRIQRRLFSITHSLQIRMGSFRTACDTNTPESIHFLQRGCIGLVVADPDFNAHRNRKQGSDTENATKKWSVVVADNASCPTVVSSLSCCRILSLVSLENKNTKTIFVHVQTQSINNENVRMRARSRDV